VRFVTDWFFVRELPALPSYAHTEPLTRRTAPDVSTFADERPEKRAQALQPARFRAEAVKSTEDDQPGAYKDSL
jgi:hypothetical protein